TLPLTLSSGTYELRLFAQNSLQRLAVSSVVTVTGLSLSASPASVAATGTVTATWAGIGAPSANDWIGMVPTGAPDAAYVTWAFTTGTIAGSRGIVVPPSVMPGTYELRLFANNSLNCLAVSGTITVPAVTLNASPSTIAPGGTVTV